MTEVEKAAATLREFCANADAFMSVHGSGVDVRPVRAALAVLVEAAERADRLEAVQAEVSSILTDWVKCGAHTQEWQFYIDRLFAALAAAVPEEETP